MFFNLMREILSLEFERLILVKDFADILGKANLDAELKAYGFRLIKYEDVENFRFIFESEIKKNPNEKVFVMVNKEIYVPYDIYNYFKVCELNYSVIFPRLNSYVLENAKKIEFDLLAIACDDLYHDLTSEAETKDFIENTIFEFPYIKTYIEQIDEKMISILRDDMDYSAWFKIAYLKAKRNIMSTKFGVKNSEIENRVSRKLNEFIMNQFGQLSGKSYFNGPVIISKVMDYLLMQKEKTAMIVMDGMSISDWMIIEKHIDVEADLNFMYAMVPTITSISRQCLLSGLLPIEHEKPFSLANEKKQFTSKAEEALSAHESVAFFRGFDFDIGYKDFFICTIINEIDDLVHSQLQGLSGHFDGIERMAKTKKLDTLIKRLINQGFEVFVTSDHGNKEALGIGKPKGTGVEVETKSQRMMILKDYASKESLKEMYHLREYPGYYLPKEYNYLICEDEEALAYQGDTIMSHGGISVEEVIVPFIRVKGDKSNE
ncbi:PglZ domain-containing protein [Anaerovirgula multivorans]|nr:PglZ domain-containing protein [Anaerovirgula multivorans]